MSLKEEEVKSRWYDEHSSMLWHKILFSEDMLGLKRDFLNHKREGGKPYSEFINEGLLCAADSMRRVIPGEMVAISQLLHTASGVVLLEGKRKRVDATLNFLRNKAPFKDIDPAVVVTSIALYFLICNAEQVYSNEKEKMESIKHVHNRLDQMNWFVGTAGINELGIVKMQ